jgi:uncharacterized protein YbdZ (MbtH family)
VHGAATRRRASRKGRNDVHHSIWSVSVDRPAGFWSDGRHRDRERCDTIIGSPLGVNRVEASSRRGLRSCGVAAASLGDPSAETLAFLSRQPRPAVRRGPSWPRNHPETAKAPEQDPAQSHETDRLLEPKGMQAEQLGINQFQSRQGQAEYRRNGQVQASFWRANHARHQ